MNLFDLIMTAIALSMDAFAVSISKGLSVKKVRPAHAMTVGGYFGGFQALMPLLGFFLASTFAEQIKRFDHWIACGLLVLIGINMIREALSRGEETHNDSFGFRTMFPLAIAVIGATTFAFSAVGLRIGNIFGSRYKARAELIGGVILILMGIKILAEHLTAAA